MSTRFSVHCDETQARAVEKLAHRYGIPEDEVITQLIDLGLEHLEESTP